ncbi:DMT family transporter [Barnesiella sp. ET7]|uniref:DMT family transporter n=1 Tax=Barnesiella sp. ET7 TaxID=2972460 RepID=UPI0021ABD887|nr:DMT family transporter [Barnesiella sp. ET7]MCR8912101.1 DMT family transporter [Barnesiella sp. ET7]
MKEKLKGHSAMFTANFLWGIMSPISKSIFLTGVISAFSLTNMRMVGAAAFFWIASLFMPRESVTKRDLLLLFAASLFGITLNQGFFVVGLSYTTPIDASVVASLTPIITMILAAFIQKEPMTGKKVIGVFMGLTGALILILDGAGSASGGSLSGGRVMGDLFCLIAEVSFAIYYVAFKGLISRYTPVTLMKWMFLFATICCLPIGGSEVMRIPFAQLDSTIYLDLFFVIFGATFLSYMLVSVGQKRLRPTIVSMYNYTQPIVASLLAIWWGMDSFDVMKGFAILLVFLGVYVVTTSKSRAQLDAELAEKAAREGAATHGGDAVDKQK